MPAEDASTERLVSRQQVKEILEKLLKGKAWGADDIPVELLVEGTMDLLELLTGYLQLLHTWKLTPTIWH